MNFSVIINVRAVTFIEKNKKMNKNISSRENANLTNCLIDVGFRNSGTPIKR